jgi:ATP-binding cassette, subfamily B, bacterial CvaB/MchF/RaxB
MRGSTHALVQIFLLSVVLEAFVIASPFYLQLTVDEVIARGDADLLVVLALGFGLLAAIKIGSNVIRSLIILIVQNVLHFQIGSRLFHHLIRLPLRISKNGTLATFSRVARRSNPSATRSQRA